MQSVKPKSKLSIFFGDDLYLALRSQNYRYEKVVIVVMRCNLQVAEALATVIKKEKDDESDKKGRSPLCLLCQQKVGILLHMTAH